MLRQNIELNALALRPGGSGVTTYIRELLRALRPLTNVTMAAHVQSDAVEELPDRVDAIRHPVESGTRRAMTGLRLATSRGLVHGLDVDLPLSTNGPTVITVHDLSVFDVPWAHARVRAYGEQLLVARAVKRADAVLAVSEFTAERVAARFGRSSTVTHLAPAPEMLPANAGEIARVRLHYRLPANVVLCVGTIEPRKRIDLLAEACERAGLLLVLAGAIGAGERVPASARHLGYVPNADLAALYAAAAAVAYVSAYEGFGLPPIEAMACNAAVVATRAGALPEILTGAALDSLVPPDDVESLVRALRAAVLDADHNSALRAAGLESIAHLSWGRTAGQTLQTYRSLGVSC